MADDTLSPLYEFDRVIVKTRCAPADRFAMSYLAEESEPGQATVRRVIDAGLTALGWPPERRVVEYADHVAHCITSGTINKYESR